MSIFRKIVKFAIPVTLAASGYHFYQKGNTKIDKELVSVNSHPVEIKNSVSQLRAFDQLERKKSDIHYLLFSEGLRKKFNDSLNYLKTYDKSTKYSNDEEEKFKVCIDIVKCNIENLTDLIGDYNNINDGIVGGNYPLSENWIQCIKDDYYKFIKICKHIDGDCYDNLYNKDWFEELISRHIQKNLKSKL